MRNGSPELTLFHGLPAQDRLRPSPRFASPGPAAGGGPGGDLHRAGPLGVRGEEERPRFPEAQEALGGRHCVHGTRETLSPDHSCPRPAAAPAGCREMRAAAVQRGTRALASQLQGPGQAPAPKPNKTETKKEIRSRIALLRTARDQPSSSSRGRGVLWGPSVLSSSCSPGGNLQTQDTGLDPGTRHLGYIPRPFIIVSLFPVRVSPCCYVARAGPELAIFLPQPPECGDYRLSGTV